MAKFTKGHYQVIAKVLSDYKPAGWGYVSDASQIKYDTAQDIMDDLIQVFKKDNPAFDADRFKKACGF